MVSEESRNTRRKNGRSRIRRRRDEDAMDIDESQLSRWRRFWEKGAKQAILTLLFAISVVFICFVGQDPPGLRTLGEVAPENIYSDRAFNYLSEVRRREAEEWIRSSTPREFSRNFSGEESFSKALIRLEEGLLAIESMQDSAAEAARLSLIEELEKNFQLPLTAEDLLNFTRWRDFPNGENLFSEISRMLGHLHLVGVVKFPSTDQKFVAEANATAQIDNLMIRLTGRLVILSGLEDGFRLFLNPEEVSEQYSALSNHLGDLRNHLEEGGPFLEEGLLLKDLIESTDANASFSAQEFRNDLASNFANLAKMGLHLRTIDRVATTAAQDRAISEMDQPIVSVQEGDLILKKGIKVTEADLEKYSKYLNLTTEDRNLLPKRIFVTFGTFVFAFVYISLILPNFWRDTARASIVSVVILVNLLISRVVLELGGTELFGGNALLVGLLPYLLPVSFASMVVMITVGPRMATLTALMTSIFHSTMQNAGIESLSVALSSALVGAFFCREVRLRGSALKAGAYAGLTGAVMALGIGVASGSGGVAAANHALASLMVGVFTGALVLGAMPLIENGFKVATDATLFELTDFNHPLLRQMQVDAPGTYHHSLMVANLSENAAVAVGANPIMCRACSLFHDIGKMAQPNYFTENQGEFGNPHNRRDPAMSALIIKSHVKEGVEMAREQRLPKVIRDVIRQHHGTTLVKYFYHEAKKRSRQETLPYGESEDKGPDESTYRYDGPKPRFKESAIIFFADSVEAAARSLPKVTQHSVEELLEGIFQDRLEDGQLDECPLTLEEVAKIKKSFIKTTLNMLHTRIEYPDDEKKVKASSDSSAPFKS